MAEGADGEISIGKQKGVVNLVDCFMDDVIFYFEIVLVNFYFVLISLPLLPSQENPRQ